MSENRFAKYVCSKLLNSTNALCLIDIGCSHGLHPRWQILGEDIQALGVDIVKSEIQRLIRSEKRASVKYLLAKIGRLYNDKESITVYTENNPWERLSVSAASKLIFDSQDDDKLKSNRWSELDIYNGKPLVIPDLIKESHLDTIDTIKIDIDSDDYHTLLSTKDAIEELKILCFELEVNFYGSGKDTEHSFYNTDKFMKINNFILSDLSVRKYSRAALPSEFVVNIPAQTKKGCPYQGDAVYFLDVCNPTTMHLFSNLPEIKLIKLALLASLFDVHDYSAEILLLYREQLDNVIDTQFALDQLALDVTDGEYDYNSYIKSFEENIQEFFPGGRFLQKACPDNNSLIILNKIKDLIIQLLRNNIDKVAIYGAGELGNTLFLELEKHSFIIDDIIDQKADNLDLHLQGKSVKGISDYTFSNDQVVLIASEVYAQEMITLVKNKNSQVKIFSLE